MQAKNRLWCSQLSGKRRWVAVGSAGSTENIRVGSGANRGAPFWGFSLEVNKWAVGPFFVCQEMLMAAVDSTLRELLQPVVEALD